MRSDANGGGSANYEPNSADGPKQAREYASQAFEIMGTAAQTPYEAHAEDNDFVQPGNLYRLMSNAEKVRLISNLAGHMKAAQRAIQSRQVFNFYRADAELGTRLGRALGININPFLASKSKR
jgi:catalase